MMAAAATMMHHNHGDEQFFLKEERAGGKEIEAAANLFTISLTHSAAVRHIWCMILNFYFIKIRTGVYSYSIMSDAIIMS